MKPHMSNQEKYIKAQSILRRRRLFYLHLVGYLIVVALNLYNIYIMDEGPYKSIFITLNLSVIGAWGVFIIIHAIDVYRRRSLFKKTWEDRKIDEIMHQDAETETKLWE